MSVIPGTTGPDTLSGTEFEDTITGGDGADSLSGLAGNDSLTGDAGADTLIGGLGDDTLEGGADNDSFVLSGSFGTDSIVGGAGLDTAVFSTLASSSAIRLDALAGVEQINMSSATLSGTGAGDTFDFSGVVTILNRALVDLAAGADRFIGSQAADNVLGGAGDDVLEGGAGADTLDGGAGLDRLLGGDGDDRFVSTGAELGTTFQGGTGVDTLALVGSAEGVTTFSRLTLDALASVETLRFETGGGLAGTAGSDRINLSGVTTVVNAAAIDLKAGADFFVGSQATDIVVGGAGSDNLKGEGGNDSLSGGEKTDVLDGGVGNDTLNGGAGSDVLIGGDGDDTFLAGGNENSSTFSGGAGLDRLAFVQEGGADMTITRLTLDADASVETLDFTSGSLSGTADGNRFDLSGVVTVTAARTIAMLGGADTFIGTQAADIVDGGNGNDLIDGGLGADTMTGGAGNDIFVVDNVADSVIEVAGGGKDTVNASVTYTLAGATETLVLTGAAAINGTGNSFANKLTGNAAANTLDGAAGADTMLGGAGNDIYVVDSVGDRITENAGAANGVDLVRASADHALSTNVENLTLTGAGNIDATGNTLANVLIGNSGANVLDGGVGADTMTGGAGNDRYVVDNVGDSITEGAGGGVDTVVSSIAFTLTGNLENLTLTGFGSLSGTGNGLDNLLVGNSRGNTLDGAGGADTMRGDLGDDVYIVDNAGDVVTEKRSAGTDTVQTSLSYTLGDQVEKLTLTGSGAISGTGNELGNTIVGNSGANAIDGGLGRDTLTGGSGADSFNFSTTLSNVLADVITDFAAGNDKIVLHQNIFEGLAVGALAATALVIGSGPLDADDRIIYNDATGALLFDKDGTGSASAIRIATLEPGLLLTEANFTVV